jgi:hypothetical protein
LADTSTTTTNENENDNVQQSLKCSANAGLRRSTERVTQRLHCSSARRRGAALEQRVGADAMPNGDGDGVDALRQRFQLQQGRAPHLNKNCLHLSVVVGAGSSHPLGEDRRER